MISDPKYFASQIRRLEDNSFKFAPQRNWNFVTVTFPSTPNKDVDVKHTLATSSPEGVQYQVVQSSMPVIVWHDRSANRVPWQDNLIRLRCTTAGASVVLLLTAVDSPVTVNPSPTSDKFAFPGTVESADGFSITGRTTREGEWDTFTPTGLLSVGTGTLTLGTVTAADYTLHNKALTIQANFLFNMSGAGAGDTVLGFKIPGGYHASGVHTGQLRFTDGATDGLGICFTNNVADPTILYVAKIPVVAFSNTAGQQCQCAITFQVD